MMSIAFWLAIHPRFSQFTPLSPQHARLFHQAFSFDLSYDVGHFVRGIPGYENGSRGAYRTGHDADAAG